jgi:hypothetical protein
MKHPGIWVRPDAAADSFDHESATSRGGLGVAVARTRVVSNILTRPGTDSPRTDGSITIALNTIGFIDDGAVDGTDTTQMIGKRLVSTDQTGLWSCELAVNEDIDPADTSYVVTQTGASGWSRWEQWCADFDAVEHDVMTLFHTRWMWRALTGLMNNGVPNQSSSVRNYFIRTYVATVCSAIRREADRDARTTSLARCLQALIGCPHFASRRRYEALRHAAIGEASSPVGDPSGDDEFSGGGEFIDIDIVRAALDRLTAAAQPIKTYTNKVRH